MSRETIPHSHASSAHPLPSGGRGNRLWQTGLRVVVVAAGLAALGWFAVRVDWPRTLDLLRRLGWLAPLLVLPYLTVYVADTTGWILTFAGRPPLPLMRLVRIRWAGESVNSVIPSGYLGGEAVKVWLLRRRGVATVDGVTAGVLSKSLQSVAQFVFLIVASLSLLSLHTAPPAVTGALAVLVTGGALALLAWFALQRRGVFGTLADGLGRVRTGGTRVEGALRRFATADARIASFRHSHPKAFCGAFLAYLSGWLLDSVEILVFTHLLGEQISWRQAIAVEAFTGLAKALSVMIPGAIGIQESSIVFLCRITGIAEPIGMAYALVRRARELLFAAIGWKLLFLEQVRVRDLKTVEVGRMALPGP